MGTLTQADRISMSPNARCLYTKACFINNSENGSWNKDKYHKWDWDMRNKTKPEYIVLI